MTLNSGSRRQGFSLPEILVTIAIVSVLAAIVVPSVTGQIGKGELARAPSTVANVRVGLTAFHLDVRRFPRRVSQLFNPIVADPIGGPQRDIFGVGYSLPVAARWRGPYMSGGMLHNDSLPLSLGAFIRDSMIDSNLVSGASGFMVASVMGVTTQAAAAQLDSLIDAGSGNDAGILQWSPGAGPIPTGAVKLQLLRVR